jgi:RNA polymerase sigma factor (sigma-70 family)
MSIKVLIADDHTILRDGLKELLNNEESIKVIGEAGDGLEAVEKTCKLKPDIVILDIIMPKMNGISSIKKIKDKNPPTEIVILSIKDDILYAYQALQAGAIGYLTKKTAADKVVRAIRLAYKGRRFISQEVNESLIDQYIIGKDIENLNPLNNLSPRERDIFKLVAEGKTSKEIAKLLHISQNTVKTYRKRLMDKLQLDTIQDLVKYAIRHEIISI